jgi:hypothetical protein
VFPDTVMRQTVHWLAVFAEDWHSEIPRRIHSREIDDGGAPQWHAEFARWLTRNHNSGYRNPDSRLRLTRAMRYLRKISPRSYEVLYRVMALGHSLESVTQWLNERAIRGNHPERYRRGDSLAILQSGVDFVCHHY